MMVVLPEPVEPAIHTLTPYRMQAIRKWSISAGGAAGIQQLLFGDCLLVDDTDRGVDAHIRVYNGRLIHRDTDVFVQKAHHTGHGVVNDHAQALSIRRTTSMACCGEENLSGILMLRPPASITSMSL